MIVLKLRCIMQVQEKKRHIDVFIHGLGLEAIKTVLVQAMPEVVIVDDDEEYIAASEAFKHLIG